MRGFLVAVTHRLVNFGLDWIKAIKNGQLHFLHVKSIAQHPRKSGWLVHS